MSEPEQIGDLIYLPSADYPYPFPVEKPPHFWMTEQTGALEMAVDAYFNGEKITPAQLALVKAYIQQYLERALLTGDADRRKLLAKLATLRTTREIERFADDLAEYGIEPF
jgi:hypothetical protein